MNITAIIAIRNEARYLQVTLQRLVDCGIQLAIIDHDSDDSSSAIFSRFDKYIIYKDRLPYKGYFSLTDQLKAKAKAISLIDSDWLIHQDADEALESPRHGETLRDGIERVDREGYNVINFDEFVFIPTKQDPDHENGDFYRSMLHYYLFEPQPARLMRAWQNIRDIRQIEGGHRLAAHSQLRVSPEAFILRHYIALSRDHFNIKYSQRSFSPEDLSQGWHMNRIKITPIRNLPDQTELPELPSWDSKDFNKDNPRKFHFWEAKWASG